MKVRPIVSIDTALRIYYTYPELDNARIRELFGAMGNHTVAVYKRAVQAVQAARGIKTAQMYTVNTTVAYEVWGIDVPDLERRRAKLQKLGLTA